MSQDTLLLSSFKYPSLNFQIEFFWKLMSWQNCAVKSQKAKVLHYAFRRFNLPSAAVLLFSVEKEIGLKNERRVAVYTWQQLYVVTCGFCLHITVISPSNA